jgi:hypothetical protein
MYTLTLIHIITIVLPKKTVIDMPYTSFRLPSWGKQYLHPQDDYLDIRCKVIHLKVVTTKSKTSYFSTVYRKGKTTTTTMSEEKYSTLLEENAIPSLALEIRCKSIASFSMLFKKLCKTIPLNL